MRRPEPGRGTARALARAPARGQPRPGRPADDEAGGDTPRCRNTASNLVPIVHVFSTFIKRDVYPLRDFTWMTSYVCVTYSFFQLSCLRSTSRQRASQRTPKLQFTSRSTGFDHTLQLKTRILRRESAYRLFLSPSTAPAPSLAPPTIFDLRARAIGASPPSPQHPVPRVPTAHGPARGARPSRPPLAFESAPPARAFAPAPCRPEHGRLRAAGPRGHGR